MNVVKGGRSIYGEAIGILFEKKPEMDVSKVEAEVVDVAQRLV